MNDTRTCNTIVLAVLVLVGLSVQTSAQSKSTPNGGHHGDWEITIALEGKQRTAILSLFSDEGEQGGQWIGVDELSELKDIKYEAGKLTFTGKGPGRDDQSTTWKFNGTVKKGKLSGTIASRDRGEHVVEGKRIQPLPDIVGNYGFSYSKGEATFALAIRVNKEGKLDAHWLTGDDKVPAINLEYEEGVLTFESRVGKYQGGLTDAKALNGTYTTADGREFSVLSRRLGTALIGTWNLEVTSDRGTRKQRLKVNRDLSGWYGPVQINEVRLKGDNSIRPSRPRTATFKIVMKTGKRTVEMSFTGKVTESKLEGEITTPTRSAKVLGQRRM